MSYTCRYLQCNESMNKVPGYETDLILSNKPYAPIPKKLVTPGENNDIWNLLFSFESGVFYVADDNVPGQDNAVIQSWYALSGGTGHYLSLTPFIVEEDGTLGSVQKSNFVDFSENSTSGNSVNTDKIRNSSVTATVHSELPELSKLEFSTRSTSHSIITTTKITQVVFDHIFVYSGSGIISGNTLTVSKNESCFALAVFKKVTRISSSETSTIQWPKILEREWPMIIAEIVKGITVKGNGEIFQYLSPKLIAETEPQILKKAISDINKRVESLDKVKSVISGIIKGKNK